MACGYAFLAIVTGLVAGVATASELAQLGGTAELEARIAALEEQLAEHDADSRIRADGVSYLPDAAEPAASACAPCGPCVGQDFAWGRCRTEGYYGGAEIMWLKPFGSTTGSVFLGGDESLLGRASADDFLPGWRLWGGHQNGDGLGWRVNWWQWDHASSGVSTLETGGGGTLIATSDVRLVFQKLDLLATQMVSFRNWDLLLLGGVTYAGQEAILNESIPASSSSQRIRFDGWGLTAGVLAYRDIGRFEGLKGYGGVQWSGVYGNSPYASTLVFPSSTSTTAQAGSSTLANILELKVGTQYERRIGWGAIGFVSAGFESQYWALPSSFIGNLGLVGFTVGTGIRR
ncbi:MAG: hypothetical protein WCH77_08025 [Planctomycetota bacterium]